MKYGPLPPINTQTRYKHDLGPIYFKVGEKVKIKGGDFRIKSIGKRFITLEKLPGTLITKGD